MNFSEERLKIRQPVSIRERVYKYFKEQILIGQITLKSILVESLLADQIGTSHTPIHQALHFIEMEGLLEIIPRASYMVRGIDLKEFKEIWETRKVLELLSVQWIIQNVTPEQLEELKDNLARAGVTSKEEDC